MKRDTVVTAVWILLTLSATLWPSRFVGPLDGVPLDAPAEAVLIGLALPSMLWFDARVLRRRAAQAVIIALLVWKAGTAMAATQQGLCLRSSIAPFQIRVASIDIAEPSGALRSWDARSDWRSPNPECTAILARPLPARDAFPAWFLNVVDVSKSGGDIHMRAHGSVVTDRQGTLKVDVGSGMTAERRLDGVVFEPSGMEVEPGRHAIDVSITLNGPGWRLEPTIDNRPLWGAAATFVREPTSIDLILAPWAWIVAPALLVTLLAGCLWRLGAYWQPGKRVMGAVLILSLLSALLALQPTASVQQRLAGLLGLLALAVPVSSKLRNLRGAFLLVGIPWLAFFAAASIAAVGRFTTYSPEDDWLLFQVAGYRIVMHGYWLEGGTSTFFYQPFYRWITGVLHMVFGDSSVGEVYWDAAWLLCGALLAFWLVRARAGFRWGLAAAALTLATFMLSTTWWFIGRGLSEVSAAGFSFLAMFFLLRARLGRLSSSAWAGVFAVLMFYTRLNHLLIPILLPGLLLPLGTPMTWNAVWSKLRPIRPVVVVVFWGVFGAGVLLFMTRAWLYSGTFSLFQGTSRGLNDTGLRVWTLLDSSVWISVTHSLAALVSVNDPLRFDPRSLLVTAGALLALAAIIQLPGARRLPAVVVIACIAAMCGAAFAHTHAYPGRFSLHLVPLATALALIGASMLWRQYRLRY